MPSDPRRRQKKQERRTAKRKEKKHQTVRAHSGGLPERLSAAAKCPVLHCLLSDAIEDQGIGWLLLSRATPSGPVAFAAFLVDRYCLGVKDVFANVVDRVTYDTKVLKKQLDIGSRSLPPAEARKFIEAAVAYAHNLGFFPHPDYQRAMLLFANVNPADSSAELEFGKDGKPFYIAGPNDTPERSRQIIATLHNTCGEGGYHFLAGMGPADVVDFDDTDEEDEGEEPALPGPS
jgi:hypothetical protein